MAYLFGGDEKVEKVNPGAHLPDTNPQEAAGTQNKSVAQKPVSDVQNGMDYTPELLKTANGVYETNSWYNPNSKDADDRRVLVRNTSRRPVGLTENERVRQGKMQAGVDLENFDNSIANGNHVARNPKRSIKYIKTEGAVVETDGNGNRKYGSRTMKPRSFLVNEKGEITNTLEATGYDANGNATGWKSSEKGRYWGDHYDPKALDPVKARPKALTGDDAVRALNARGAIDRVAARLRNGEAPSQATIEARQRWAAQPGSRPTQSGRALAQAQQVQSYLSSTDAAADRYREMQKNNNLYSTKVRPTRLSGEENYQFDEYAARARALRRLRYEDARQKAEVNRLNAEAKAMLEMPKVTARTIAAAGKRDANEGATPKAVATK